MPIEVKILLIMFLVLVGINIINYIIRIIKVKDKRLKVLWSIVPIIGILFSVIFVNGVNSANMWIINAIGIVLEIFMIGLYNIYIYYYFDEKIRPIITLVLYNLASVLFCINETGIFYLHHFYLGMLIFAIPVAIIEMLIKNKIKKNR